MGALGGSIMATRQTLAARVDALTVAVEALVAAQAPVGARTTAQAGEPVHVGPSGKPDGRRFLCTADKPCGRLLRSAKRAAVHGVDAGGHIAA
jgi:hypothetical protein